MNKKIPTFLIICFITYNSFSQSKILSAEDLKTVSIDSYSSWIRQHAYTGKDLDNFHAIGLQTLKRSLKSKDPKLIASVDEELKSEEGLGSAYRSLGVLYRVTGYFEKSIEYTLKAIPILEETYTKLGNFENAPFYKDKATSNSTKILEDKIADLKTETIIKYETGKTQTLIIAVAVLLGLLLLSLLYFFNKNKKATNDDLVICNFKTSIILLI